MGYLIGKMEEMISRLQAEGNKPVQIVLNLTGNLAALAWQRKQFCYTTAGAMNLRRCGRCS